MINQHLQQDKLDVMDIKVIDFPDASFTTIVDGKRYIAVDSNATDIERYWIIEHELMHNVLNNFYDKNTNESTIKNIERNTDEMMLIVNGAIKDITTLISEGMPIHVIQKTLGMDDKLFEHALMLIMRLIVKGVYK